MAAQISNNERIAKNTVVLYFRTIFLMLLSLYTSRVILNVLGVEDFGVYNVVGGVVAMFTVISGALSNSIARFITYELGHGDFEKLKQIFSTSIIIQFIIAVFIVVIGEVVGVWFVNNKLVIPDDRIVAANWVLQCSLVVFAVNLLSIPYNACITSHEHMKAFAYINILEAVLKLGIVFILMFFAQDMRLIVYSCLLLTVAVIIRVIYCVYCHRNFEESHFRLEFNPPILKEMFGFAGWNFFTNAAWIFNTQGVNIVINMYFDVFMNAARGVATQVQGAATAFVENFSTAINPQITKAYSSGDMQRMLNLVCYGAKYSYFLLYVLALPITLEAPLILKLWLGVVPDYSVIFVRLSFFAAISNVIGHTAYIACMSTGKIKRYVLLVTPVGCMVFFLTWLAYHIGMPAETTYYIYIIIYIVIAFIALFEMRRLIGFSMRKFIKEVFLKITIASIPSMLLPLAVVLILPSSIFRLCLTTVVSLISTISFIYWIGLNRNEKHMLVNYIKRKFSK